MDFHIPHLQYNLDEGLNSNQLDVKNLQLCLKCSHNLPVLLIDMDEERLKACIDGLSKESKIEFKQRVEENQFKTVV